MGNKPSKKQRKSNDRKEPEPVYALAHEIDDEEQEHIYEEIEEIEVSKGKQGKKQEPLYYKVKDSKGEQDEKQEPLYCDAWDLKKKPNTKEEPLYCDAWDLKKKPNTKQEPLYYEIDPALEKKQDEKQEPLFRVIIKASIEEQRARQIHLTYSSNKDTYRRPLMVNNFARGFKTWMFTSENVCRTEDSESNMAYLSTCDGSKEAMMEWRFDAGESFKITDIIIHGESFTVCDANIGFLRWYKTTTENKSDWRGKQIVIVTATFGPEKTSRIFHEKLDILVEDATFDIKLTLAKKDE